MAKQSDIEDGKDLQVQKAIEAIRGFHKGTHALRDVRESLKGHDTTTLAIIALATRLSIDKLTMLRDS